MACLCDNLELLTLPRAYSPYQKTFLEQRHQKIAPNHEKKEQFLFSKNTKLIMS